MSAIPDAYSSTQRCLAMKALTDARRKDAMLSAPCITSISPQLESCLL
jgi:hypothetical protein